MTKRNNSVRVCEPAAYNTSLAEVNRAGPCVCCMYTIVYDKIDKKLSCSSLIPSISSLRLKYSASGRRRRERGRKAEEEEKKWEGRGRGGKGKEGEGRRGKGGQEEEEKGRGEKG